MMAATNEVGSFDLHSNQYVLFAGGRCLWITGATWISTTASTRTASATSISAVAATTSSPSSTEPRVCASCRPASQLPVRPDTWTTASRSSWPHPPSFHQCRYNQHTLRVSIKVGIISTPSQIFLQCRYNQHTLPLSHTVGIISIPSHFPTLSV